MFGDRGRSSSDFTRSGELMACYTCHPEKHSTWSQNNDGVRYSNSEKEDKGVAGNTFQNSLKISQIKLKLSCILKVKITNMIKDTQILLLKTEAEISWKDFTESTEVVLKRVRLRIPYSLQNYWGAQRTFICVG